MAEVQQTRRFGPTQGALLLLFAAALPGCLAKAAADVVTLPVRAAGAAVDAATTSQSEADEKRGRALRERDERLGRLEREYGRQAERCRDGSSDGCRRARELEREIGALLAGSP
jgi:hypothetical protein